jgi:hypothetical protein
MMGPELKAKLLDRGPRDGLFFEEGPEVVALIERLEVDLAAAQKNSGHAAAIK